MKIFVLPKRSTYYIYFIPSPYKIGQCDEESTAKSKARKYIDCPKAEVTAYFISLPDELGWYGVESIFNLSKAERYVYVYIYISDELTMCLIPLITQIGQCDAESTIRKQNLKVDMLSTSSTYYLISTSLMKLDNLMQKSTRSTTKQKTMGASTSENRSQNAARWRLS